MLKFLLLVGLVLVGLVGAPWLWYLRMRSALPGGLGGLLGQVVSGEGEILQEREVLLQWEYRPPRWLRWTGWGVVMGALGGWLLWQAWGLSQHGATLTASPPQQLLFYAGLVAGLWGLRQLRRRSFQITTQGIEEGEGESWLARLGKHAIPWSAVEEWREGKRGIRVYRRLSRPVEASLRDLPLRLERRLSSILLRFPDDSTKARALSLLNGYS